MRKLLVLWLLALWTSNAFGQVEAVEDTLDWRAYYPLQAGNTWEYESGNKLYGVYPDHYERREVVSDTLLGGRHYYVHSTRHYDASLNLVGSEEEYLRYDTTENVVVSLIQTDTLSFEQVWPEPGLTCDLSAAFGSTIVCDHEEVYVEGGYNESWQPSDGETVARAWKGYTVRGTGMAVWLFNGPGNWGYSADWEPGYERKLIYIQVGDAREGASVVATGIDRAPSMPGPREKIAVFPNPAFDTITVTYDIDQVKGMGLELYNVLGQRVYEGRIGGAIIGKHSTSIEVSQLSAGTYTVRMYDEAGEAIVSHFVIVR